MVADEMGIDDQEAHGFLKNLFLKTEERSSNGKYRYVRTTSTTELNDQAYRSYWTKCQRWASLPTKASGLGIDSGLSLYIPDPNEVDYDNY